MIVLFFVCFDYLCSCVCLLFCSIFVVFVVLVLSLVLISDYDKKNTVSCAILVFCVMLVNRLFLLLIFVFSVGFLVGLFASFSTMKLECFMCVVFFNRRLDWCLVCI